MFAVTGEDPLLKTALALRDAALADDYFIKRRLAPNVDFYVRFRRPSAGRLFPD